MAGRCDYRRLQPTRAGPPPLSRRRSLDPGAAAAARAADRNLTSQLFANIYLDGFDHFCTEILRPKGYLRYVDDLALFHDDPSVLDDYRDRIAVFLAGRRLSLILARRRSAGRTNPQPSSAMCCRRAGGVCRKKIYAASATAGEVCAIAFARAAWARTKPHGISARVSRMPSTPIPGACVMSSFGAARSIPPAIRSSALARRAPSGSLAGPATPLRFARRLLEQQSEEPSLRLPQQERHRQPEQQHRVPSGPHTLDLPEPARSPTRRERVRVFRTVHDERRPGPCLDRTER